MDPHTWAELQRQVAVQVRGQRRIISDERESSLIRGALYTQTIGRGGRGTSLYGEVASLEKAESVLAGALYKTSGFHLLVKCSGSQQAEREDPEDVEEMAQKNAPVIANAVAWTRQAMNRAKYHDPRPMGGPVNFVPGGQTEGKVITLGSSGGRQAEAARGSGTELSSSESEDDKPWAWVKRQALVKAQAKARAETKKVPRSALGLAEPQPPPPNQGVLLKEATAQASQNESQKVRLQTAFSSGAWEETHKATEKDKYSQEDLKNIMDRYDLEEPREKLVLRPRVGELKLLPNAATFKEDLFRLSEKVTGKKVTATKPITPQTFYSDWKPRLILRPREEVIAGLRQEPQSSQLPKAVDTSGDSMDKWT